MRAILLKTNSNSSLVSAVLTVFAMSLLAPAARSQTSPGRDARPSGAKKQQLELLPLLSKKTPQPNYGTKPPSRVTGRVTLVTNKPRNSVEKSAGAPGVSVSDGFTVVKTDSNGAYSLTPDSRAVFVFITRPSGHDVVGDWYKPVASQVNFAVTSASRDESEFVFVHVTDTHVSQNLRSRKGLSQFVREVNGLTPRPHFVVNSGDLLNLHKALISSPDSGRADFRQYVGIMNHLKIPCYNVAGDHTDSSYRLDQYPRGHLFCGKPLYWEHLGPHFFSFEYGKIHFVSVDYGYHLGRRQVPVSGKQLEYPTLEVQPAHVDWLRRDMANRTKGQFVITTSEYDLTKHCPDFADIANEHDVRLQLVGDHHVLSHKKRPVPYRTGGALAGCWWNSKAKQLCPDLRPQGYLIYRVKGEKLDFFYKGLGRRIEIVSHRIGAVTNGRVTIQAHLVQPEPGESLEYSVYHSGKANDAQRRWTPMHESDRPFYRAVFAAQLDTQRFSDGMVTVAVRSTSGSEVRTREFVVANGNGPNASADANLSFEIAPPNSWTLARKPAGKVEVLVNKHVVGGLEPKTAKKYSFEVPKSVLATTNTLEFRFTRQGDGMTLRAPRLTFRGDDCRDHRDRAIDAVKTAHWGAKAATWGGFIVGDAAPPDETPFDRKQNVFCFVLDDVARSADAN